MEITESGAEFQKESGNFILTILTRQFFRIIDKPKISVKLCVFGISKIFFQNFESRTNE